MVLVLASRLVGNYEFPENHPVWLRRPPLHRGEFWLVVRQTNSPLWRGALQGGVVPETFLALMHALHGTQPKAFLLRRSVGTDRFPETTPFGFAVHPSTEGNWSWLAL